MKIKNTTLHIPFVLKLQKKKKKNEENTEKNSFYKLRIFFAWSHMTMMNLIIWCRDTIALTMFYWYIVMFDKQTKNIKNNANFATSFIIATLLQATDPKRIITQLRTS